MTTSERGFRELPHTADLRFEAWAQSREECVAEAIMALVSTFIDAPALARADSARFDIAGDTDADLLLGALDEIIFLMDTSDRVPISATVVPMSAGLRVECECGTIQNAELHGAVPKAVSWHELEFGPTTAGWQCRVTVDI